MRLVDVRGVNNHIEVARVDDPNVGPIRNLIQAALSRLAEQAVKRVSVDVSDVEVSLTGRVRSWGAAGHC
jgi:osmotically-inducible protein OsmY